MKRLHALISGKVQGVGFRYFTQKQANTLSLVGIARNLADGRVEVIAEGDEQSLKALQQWLQRGSPAANVESVSVIALNEITDRTYSQFSTN
ncbi:acylphosphatase [Aliagarivorans marinus]|uniref:acylphosphatase n=1 Tax=Aliagarivorans marinus TaxID=561965 RepID=UPI0005501B9D|nr:acylphosphatase [Aliagarivorans marinus]